MAGSTVALVVHRRHTPPVVREVEAQISALQTLVTTEYQYRDVIYFGEHSRFLGLPAGSREILFAVTITVTAGVDLTRGVDVQIDSTTPSRVYVTLPGAAILRVNADERSIHQYFARERMGRLDWVAISDTMEEAKTRNREDAVQRGILRRSEDRTREIVTRALSGSGFRHVEIRFTPTERNTGGEIQG